MSNLSHLITGAARANPDAIFGTFQQNDRLDGVAERAGSFAGKLRAFGFGRGNVVAVIGPNSASYLVMWMGAQLAGVQTALINPAYPDEFLEGMLDDLAPQAIIWVGRAPGKLAERKVPQFDATYAWDGSLSVVQDGRASAQSVESGGDCAYEEIAAYLHTSGTSGNPKFCALSHGYFLRLGRYFADVMSFSNQDTVFNPLPLFHINPMGNGVVGALTGRSGFLSTERFSAPDFWPMVKQHKVTALILHAPPANLLRSKTTGEQAKGHKVRIGFALVPSFLAEFGIPVGVGAYGSTEAGGLCHSWKFRPGDEDLPPEGALHLAGQPRYDLECRLADDGEILVRAKAPEVLFSGYAKGGTITPQLDKEGWFHTGDRGRWDGYGNLVFIERISESIRVNAEYVPIDFVEDRLKQVVSLGEFALWRVDSQNRGHEAVVYTTSAAVDLGALRGAVADLPRYMQPTQLIRIESIPRDAGVGKIQRRLLGSEPVLEVQPL